MPSLSGVIKQASRGADLYFVFRFLRLLTMKWTKTDAYKYKIIDAKGNALKQSSELESVDEKAAYTMLHRMVFKIRRLIEKIPLIGKSILMNYAAALFLLKEQNDKRVWTDENYMERKLQEFLESDWEEEAGQLKEVFRGQYGLTQANEFLTERAMTDGEKKKREDIVLSMKKKSSDLKAKYGDDWENIMYATATKQAMDESITADKGRNMKNFTGFQLDEIKFEAGKVYHQDTDDGPLYFKAGEQQKNKKWKGLVLDIGKKKPKNGSADETLRFWKATPDSDIPPSLKESVQLAERTGYAKFSPFPPKVLTDFAKRAKKAGLDFDQYKKFVKQTFKDGADENNHYIWGRDVYFPKGKQPNLESVQVDEKWKEGTYTLKDGETGKVLGKYKSGAAAQRAMNDLVKKADYENLSVELDEDAKMGKQSDDQLKKIYKTASEKDQSSPANKSFTQRIAKEMKKRGIQEEVPTNSAGGGNVAGLGVGPQGEPGVHPKKKKKKPAWEDSRVLMNKFAGKDVFIVDSDMFYDCRMGKKKYHRYEKYVGTQRTGNAIREYGRKFPGRPIILQNGEDGPMLYLRYGRS
ncbi:MAG TPA: hypothetical protein EYF95_05105 [Flavobacteriales bacterium]|nr:hypothetical protein [Flavobacteriales bacterium]